MSSRPNRSDVHLSEDAAAKLEATTRDYFDDLAPKRPAKPPRSEYESQSTLSSNHPGVDDSRDIIPHEFLQFQHLEKDDTQKLQINSSQSQVPEEFTETEYYTDLNFVDKQHHTTGSGFIKVDGSGKSFSLAPDSCDQNHHASCKGNPATNDWIPSPTPDMVDFNSGKPSRSE